MKLVVFTSFLLITCGHDRETSERNHTDSAHAVIPQVTTPPAEAIPEETEEVPEVVPTIPDDGGANPPSQPPRQWTDTPIESKVQIAMDKDWNIQAIYPTHSDTYVSVETGFFPADWAYRLRIIRRTSANPSPIETLYSDSIDYSLATCRGWPAPTSSAGFLGFDSLLMDLNSAEFVVDGSVLPALTDAGDGDCDEMHDVDGWVVGKHFFSRNSYVVGGEFSNMYDRYYTNFYKTDLVSLSRELVDPIDVLSDPDNGNWSKNGKCRISRRSGKVHILEDSGRFIQSFDRPEIRVKEAVVSPDSTRLHLWLGGEEGWWETYPLHSHCRS